MKHLVIAAAALCALGLSSCNEASKLAKNIEGTWSGAPERLIDDPTGTATVIESTTFAVDSTGKGGDMIIVGLVSATGQMQGSTAIIQPISISAAAKAEVLGKWQAIDDDEIQVSIDTRTLTVSIDPEGVVLTTNMLDGDAQANVASIKPQLAEAVKQQRIREAEGEAEALLTVQKAQANAIRMINEANPNHNYLALRSMEAMEKVADGKATKLIVPSDMQNLAATVSAIKEISGEVTE